VIDQLAERAMEILLDLRLRPATMVEYRGHARRFHTYVRSKQRQDRSVDFGEKIFALYLLDTCKASTDVKRAGKIRAALLEMQKRGDLRTKDGRIWAASDDTMRLAKAHQQMKKIGVAGKPSRLAFTTARMRQQEANKKLVPMIWKWRASTSCEAIP